MFVIAKSAPGEPRVDAVLNLGCGGNYVYEFEWGSSCERRGCYG